MLCNHATSFRSCSIKLRQLRIVKTSIRWALYDICTCYFICICKQFMLKKLNNSRLDTDSLYLAVIYIYSYEYEIIRHLVQAVVIIHAPDCIENMLPLKNCRICQIELVFFMWKVLHIIYRWIRKKTPFQLQTVSVLALVYSV